MIKESMVEACRVLVGEQLVAGFGHVSCRVAERDGGGFLITPRDPLISVAEDQLVHVPVSPEQADPLSRPPVEWRLHAEVYERRPDVVAICRTHSKMVSVLGISGREVRVVHGLGCWLGPRVPLFDSVLLASDASQAKLVVDALGPNVAVVMRGNGSLAVGTSIEEAGVRALMLEESAELQLLAGLSGTVRWFEDEEVRRRHEQDHDDEVRRAWAHYVQRHSPERR
jgi:ribulose-5-phosphate 4-epimerase/fuculose-1-phosphate aldolase